MSVNGNGYGDGLLRFASPKRISNFVVRKSRFLMHFDVDISYASFSFFLFKDSKKADRLRQNLRPLSRNRKIPQRQADVRIFFKEGAWLTNPLPRSAT